MKKGLLQPLQKEQLFYKKIFENVADGLIISDLETGRVLEANPAACAMHGYNREDFIGLQVLFIIHPDSRDDFNECVRTFQTDDVFDTRILHVRRDSSAFYSIWRGTTLTFEGRPCLLGIVRDITKRVETEYLLQENIQARAHEQATLLEISHTLASTLELQPGLILDQLRKIVKYTHGGLFALEGETLITLATRGTPQLERLAPIRINLDTPEILVALFNSHRPIRISNIWSDDSQAQFLRALLIGKASVLLEEMRSWMWVPLAVKGRIIGGVGVAHEDLNYFTAHHADLALSVANQAAITMINTELYGQAQALAILEERQSLARDLHDAINQSLFSAGLIAEVLPRLWEKDQEEGRRSLEDLRRLTRGAMAEMRSLLAELRPSTLIDSELGELLHILGNALTGRTNLPVVVTVIGDFVPPSAIQVAYYQVCQEALNNIAKHAKASHVEIDLKQEQSAFEMRIRDDGHGFDLQQRTVSGHYGLSMMRERAEAVGARLTVTSQPDYGTEIIIRWDKPQPKESL